MVGVVTQRVGFFSNSDDVCCGDDRWAKEPSRPRVTPGSVWSAHLGVCVESVVVEVIAECLDSDDLVDVLKRVVTVDSERLTGWVAAVVPVHRAAPFAVEL